MYSHRPPLAFLKSLSPVESDQKECISFCKHLHECLAVAEKKERTDPTVKKTFAIVELAIQYLDEGGNGWRGGM
jgi:hypothetical protein